MDHQKSQQNKITQQNNNKLVGAHRVNAFVRRNCASHMKAPRISISNTHTHTDTKLNCTTAQIAHKIWISQLAKKWSGEQQLPSYEVRWNLLPLANGPRVFPIFAAASQPTVQQWRWLFVVLIAHCAVRRSRKSNTPHHTYTWDMQTSRQEAFARHTLDDGARRADMQKERRR